MKITKALILMTLAMVVISLNADTASAWCTPRILVCGDAIDSTTAQGHDDVNRFNCTGSTRFDGNAHVYKLNHPGGDLAVALDWAGDADADSALHVFLLNTCNRNDCFAHDPRSIEGNYPSGDIWIIVEGRRNAADGTPYQLRVFCGDHQLPVELLSFSGAQYRDGIFLSWSTATETDNDFFRIERSHAGQSDWMELVTIQGQGTSASQSQYSYFDDMMVAGTYNYRLTSVNMDGTEEVIGTTAVTVAAAPISGETVTDFMLTGSYPNPFNPSTTIQFEVGEAANITLDVYDVSGRQISTLASGEHASGHYEVAFSGADLASGVYFARLSSPSRSEMLKMILMK
jgi:hypothetical protein